MRPRPAHGRQRAAAQPALPGGAQYRGLRTKLGAPKAITAMAHRLARLVYRMLKYGQRYVDKGAEYYEQRTAPVLTKKGGPTRFPVNRGQSQIA